MSKTQLGANDYVFGNTDNPHWTYGGLRKSMITFCEEYSLTHMRLHRLRHTAATRMGTDKSEFKHLMEHFGWEKQETAMKYIDKKNEKVLKANRKKLNSLASESNY